MVHNTFANMCQFNRCLSLHTNNLSELTFQFVNFTYDFVVLLQLRPTKLNGISGLDPQLLKLIKH